MTADMFAHAMNNSSLRKVASTGGGVYSGPCPLCGQGKDCFSIVPKRNLWLCRKCSDGRYKYPRQYFEKLGEEPKSYRIQHKPMPEREPRWMRGFSVEPYLKHPRRFELWNSYKQIGNEAIERYKMGIGILPKYSSKCEHARLIFPIYDGSELVALRGRSLGCACGKMLWAKGMRLDKLPLFGWEFVKKTSTVLVCENPVDAIMVNQQTDYVGIATHSTSYWRQSWTDILVEINPQQIIISYDNDLAGNGGHSVRVGNRIIKGIRKTLLQEWETAWGKMKPPPVSKGRELAQKLRDAGLNCTLYPWGQSPKGMDIGELLS